MTKGMVIEAKGTLILDAAIIGEKQNVALAPGEWAMVPFAYGQHLVNDKFANQVSDERIDARKEEMWAKRAKAEAAAAEADRRSAEEADRAKAVAAAVKADADRKAAEEADRVKAAAAARAKAAVARKAAEDAVASAKADLAAASDDAAKAQAQAALDAAETTLAGLGA